MIIVMLLSAVDMSAARKRTRSVSSVKQEQKANAQAIKKTSQQLDENAKATSRTLNALNTLGAEIRQQNDSIASINHQIDSIDSAMKHINDSIVTLDGKLNALRDSYARSVTRIRNSQQGSMDKLAFIFSAESFTQAYRRFRYLGEFSKWRKRRNDEIKAVQARLEKQRDELTRLQGVKSGMLTRMNVARNDLEKKQNETSALVAKLKKEGASLKKVLRQKEAQARALDNELDRLIAEEQRRQAEEEKRRQAEEKRKEQERLLAEENARKKQQQKEQEAKAAPAKAEQPERKAVAQPKPASTAAKPATNYAMAETSRKLTGSFESNKGRLLFPVNGKYKIVRPFGRHKHPDLPHVTTDNGGIDIEVPAGGTARAVFDGTVSEVFRLPGYNTIVMVRHGKYLTIYANLSNIRVKKGDALKQGQTIGTIYSDPDDGNRSILHFELRQEKQKLNPTAWVR
ncbi:peptidoglycan DD-metalloendopeptidase family protein [uncultured Muribaculum sp.]|uniref:murein hydrolase activator EnvC family protein n=1 Tax=uncultured Muribaculum sp. TaxID=1918613 RepID=UPI00259412C3|nr:peptidoglycan DD-metalloendopeptidase family protein [uncultured Muribaculum sp.]